MNKDVNIIANHLICRYTPAHSSLFLMAALLHFKDRHDTTHSKISSRSKKIQVVFGMASSGKTGPSVGGTRNKKKKTLMIQENTTPALWCLLK